MSRTLPQQSYFPDRWPIAGTSWTMSGHSRALERTGFHIPEVGIVLDAGVDLPTPTKQPNMVLISHTHIDHMGAIASLVRHQESKDSFHIFAPRMQIHRLRQFVQLSFSVKVDYTASLVEHYGPPPDSEAVPDVGSVLRDLSGRLWHPVEPGEAITMAGGKKGGLRLLVKTLQLFHTISAIGYAVFEVRSGVRPDLLGKTPKETGDNVKAAKARGENPNVDIEVPRFAFLCDTTAQALAADTPTSQAALSCPSIIIECTYLGPEFASEADKRGHVWWGALLPYVQQQLAKGVNTTWVLVHFSLRYSDSEILAFFMDPTACGLDLVVLAQPAKQQQQQQQQTPRCSFCGNALMSNATNNATTATPPTTTAAAAASTSTGTTTTPPNIVLWLDTGVKELYLKQSIAQGQTALSVETTTNSN